VYRDFLGIVAPFPTLISVLGIVTFCQKDGKKEETILPIKGLD
jgi:hypothetical protein